MSVIGKIVAPVENRFRSFFVCSKPKVSNEKKWGKFLKIFFLTAINNKKLSRPTISEFDYFETLKYTVFRKSLIGHKN